MSAYLFLLTLICIRLDGGTLGVICVIGMMNGIDVYCILGFWLP